MRRVSSLFFSFALNSKNPLFNFFFLTCGAQSGLQKHWHPYCLPFKTASVSKYCGNTVCNFRPDNLFLRSKIQDYFACIISKNKCMQRQFSPIWYILVALPTAQKVSVFGVISVFSAIGLNTARITPNTDTFHALFTSFGAIFKF